MHFWVCFASLLDIRADIGMRQSLKAATLMGAPL